MVLGPGLVQHSLVFAHFDLRRLERFDDDAARTLGGELVARTEDHVFGVPVAREPDTARGTRDR